MDIIAKDLIAKYGRPVSIIIDQNAPPETTRAFIQPVRCDDHQTLCGHYVDTEASENENFLYIGKPDVRLDLYPVTTIIQTETGSYTLKKAETVTISDQIVFIRAILAKNQ